MSATQSRFGASASKRRSTRSGAGRAWTFRRVVRGPRRRLTPATPTDRMTRATRLRLTATPAATATLTHTVLLLKVPVSGPLVFGHI